MAIRTRLRQKCNSAASIGGASVIGLGLKQQTIPQVFARKSAIVASLRADLASGGVSGNLPTATSASTSLGNLLTAIDHQQAQLDTIVFVQMKSGADSLPNNQFHLNSQPKKQRLTAPANTATTANQMHNYAAMGRSVQVLPTQKQQGSINGHGGSVMIIGAGNHGQAYHQHQALPSSFSATSSCASIRAARGHAINGASSSLPQHQAQQASQQQQHHGYYQFQAQSQQHHQQQQPFTRHGSASDHEYAAQSSVLFIEQPKAVFVKTDGGKAAYIANSNGSLLHSFQQQQLYAQLQAQQQKQMMMAQMSGGCNAAVNEIQSASVRGPLVSRNQTKASIMTQQESCQLRHLQAARARHSDPCCSLTADATSQQHHLHRVSSMQQGVDCSNIARQEEPANIGDLQLGRSDAFFPRLNWADKRELFNLMCWKDRTYKRNPLMLDNHPTIQPQMRSILCDWMNEVCESYKLHRETYHLAIDYVDRYLSSDKGLDKNQLQLLGITCVFIAAKNEEIYPPKCEDFAFVTDGACEHKQILKMETIVLTKLNWALSPVTVNTWMMLYLQLREQLVTGSPLAAASEIASHHTNYGRAPYKADFLYPQYQRLVLMKIAQLVDLCLLDIGSLEFSYGVLAAAAFFYMFGEAVQLTCSITGFAWPDLSKCISWMLPFAEVVAGQGDPLEYIRPLPDVSPDDLQNIQMHHTNLDLLEQVRKRQQYHAETPRCSPVFANRSGADIYPTPPSSDERPGPPPSSGLRAVVSSANFPLVDDMDER